MSGDEGDNELESGKELEAEEDETAEANFPNVSDEDVRR